MKQFATFGRLGEQWELLEGPNADGDGQRKKVKSTVTAGGNGKHEEIILVDLKTRPDKRRKLDPAKGGKPSKKKA